VEPTQYRGHLAELALHDAIPDHSGGTNSRNEAVACFLNIESRCADGVNPFASNDRILGHVPKDYGSSSPSMSTLDVQVHLKVLTMRMAGLLTGDVAKQEV
jgi:hypothetical protein